LNQLRRWALMQHWQLSMRQQQSRVL